MLSGCFQFGVFEIFVSNLFLLPIYRVKLCCVSGAYENLTDSQEEDNDDLLESILRYNKDMHDDTTKLYLWMHVFCFPFSIC